MMFFCKWKPNSVEFVGFIGFTKDILYWYPDLLIVFTENAELVWDEESISEHKFKLSRLLYIEGSTLGILIIFPGLEKATREFAPIIPIKKMNVRGNKNLELNIL